MAKQPTATLRQHGEPDKFERVWRSFNRLKRLFNLDAPYVIIDREIDILDKRLRAMKIERDCEIFDKIIEAASRDASKTKTHLVGLRQAQSSRR